MSDTTPPRHDPTICVTGRHGTWVARTCGWISKTYGSQIGANLEFGEHLVDAWEGNR